MVNPENRIQTYYSSILYDGTQVEYHHFTRYVAGSTNLWIFVTGLGDQAMMAQLGDAFLAYMDNNPDPELGNIILSMGLGLGAKQPWSGDHHILYPWAVVGKSWRDEYLDDLPWNPELIIATSPVILDEAREHGYDTLYCPPAVGRFFKPLGLARDGLGYAGLDSKTPAATDAIIGPYVDDPRFEWRSRDGDAEFLELPQLNEWYNSKQILFGIQEQGRVDMGYLPSRVFETLGSGTPLIITRNPHMARHLGFDYRYQSSSAEETIRHVEHILGDYPRAHGEVLEMSAYLRKNHNYVTRITSIIDKLKETKK